MAAVISGANAVVPGFLKTAGRPQVKWIKWVDERTGDYLEVEVRQMKDSPQRDLAVADDLGRMADARIRELESERREFQTLIRMCLQQLEFQYGKRQRGWDAKFLMDRCEALLGIQAQDTAIDSSSAFVDYLPLSPVRIAPGEYAIKDRTGRTLWTMNGAALADWVCQSVNGYDGAVSAMLQR